MGQDNTIGGHISRQYDEELEAIRARVLKMGGFLESQLSRALDAMAENNTSDILDVVERDHTVNEMEITIDEECTNVLAMRQPAAGDLRMIVSTAKSVRDLERIGDEIARFAKMIERALNSGLTDSYLKGLMYLGEQVKKMLHSTLNAYARMETRRAVKNIHRDLLIDEEYSQVVLGLMDMVKSDPEQISQILNLLWAARSLERIGDHCINICENVIYLVEGQDVRHTNIDNIKEQLSED